VREVLAALTPRVRRIPGLQPRPMPQPVGPLEENP
jgi:hypothetical protein